jgi:hypothetical protein
MNPVTGGAIYNALQDIVTSITSKPTIESAEANSYIPILSYKPVGQDEYLEKALKLNQVLWNPVQYSLKAGHQSNDTGNNNYDFLFGMGLTASSEHQLIFGKYNNNNANNIFELGYGNSALSKNNVFEVSKDGDVTADGTITDGLGNVLSNKQNLLEYDTIPTYNSQKVMKSGDIYNTLVDVGITPGEGIYIPQLNSLQTQINTLDSSLTSVAGRVTNIENTIHEITDDVTQDVYILGISNGELYIRLKNDPEPEPEPDEDEPEEET